jgi:AraC-like DNA-binding protein
MEGRTLLFEHTRPSYAGYFQCDIPAERKPRDPATEASLLYVTSGQGVWTIGEWSFPVSRGDMFAIPCGMAAKADLNVSRPLGYYYVNFSADEKAPGSLGWPWELPAGVNIATAPRASGPFRPEIASRFRALQDELRRDSSTANIAARAHLMLLGVYFFRMLTTGNRTSGRQAPLGRTLPEPVARVVDYVLGRLDKDLSLGELAGVAGLSERRFVDIFREVMGQSPMAYVRDRRVREAQRLLTHGVTIKDVANRLNFADTQHFSRVFRETTGITPTDYASGKAPIKQRPTGEFNRATRPAM